MIIIVVMVSGHRVQSRYQECELGNHYSKLQPKCDNHNKYRQHDLALEKEWLTNNWENRMHATALGQLMVDAFLARVLVPKFRSKYKGTGKFKLFVKNAAMQLLTNKWRSAKLREKTERGKKRWLSALLAAGSSPSEHKVGRSLLFYAHTQAHRARVLVSRHSGERALHRRFGERGHRALMHRVLFKAC